MVKVGDECSKEFGVYVGIHQGSVLSPLLFIIVIKLFLWVSELVLRGNYCTQMLW